MATFVKFQNFVEDLGKGVHQLHAAGHTLKVFLTNDAPNVATHTVKADLTDLTTTGGYTAGGEDAQNDYTEATGTGTLTCVDIVWTGSGGGFGPFRYAVLYNDTPSSPLDPLVAYWDYGSSISVAASETFTVDFGATTATIV
jgi:hypothetical protein